MITIWVCIALLVALCPACLHCAETAESRSPRQTERYKLIYGWDCVQPPYVLKVPSAKSLRRCEGVCSYAINCQAFTMTEGLCRVFVFNKCSKNVRSCNCDRVSPLYLKQQPGLPPGVLCPFDFTYNRCGVKYKFIKPSTGRWDHALGNCSAQLGLSIMAETIDRASYDYLVAVYNSRIRESGGGLLWYLLGGNQDPGSPEPAGGWFWSTCRIPIDPNLWHRGQPDNTNSNEHYAGTYPGPGLLNDFPIQPRTGNFFGGAFCECVTPFDLN